MPCQLGESSVAGSSTCSPCPGECMAFEGTALPVARKGAIPFGAVRVVGVGGHLTSDLVPVPLPVCQPFVLGHAVAQYSAIRGGVCTACPRGSYGTATGQSKCLACGPGRSSSAGSTTCQPCTYGMYNSQPVGVCLPCPTSTYSAVNGAAECTRCPPGQPSAPRVGKALVNPTTPQHASITSCCSCHPNPPTVLWWSLNARSLHEPPDIEPIWRRTLSLFPLPGLVRVLILLSHALGPRYSPVLLPVS